MAKRPVGNEIGLSGPHNNLVDNEIVVDNNYDDADNDRNHRPKKPTAQLFEVLQKRHIFLLFGHG
jgi:hypothetical protein